MKVFSLTIWSGHVSEQIISLYAGFRFVVGKENPVISPPLTCSLCPACRGVVLNKLFVYFRGRYFHGSYLLEFP